MGSGTKSARLRIGGMTCANCQNKIENKLRHTAGVQSVNVSYGDGTADITYDTDIISLRDIDAVIEKLDYRVLPDDEPETPRTSRAIGLLIIISALFLLLRQFGI
jgi:copper chaperone CopZ